MTIIERGALPSTGNSHELQGYLHGEAPVCLIFFDGPPGSGPAMHSHPYAEVFVILEGQATFTVGDDVIAATAGHVLVAPPGIPHTFINTGDGPLRQIDIHANDRFVTDWLEA